MKNEIKFTGGLGAYFWSAIPGALGGAALSWLAFVSGCLDLQQQRTFASRMDNRVGVIEPLKNPVRLVIRNRSCMTIQKAFIDADKVTAYVKNTCGREDIDYMAWYVQALSPDGTIIQSWYTNQDGVPLQGQQIEVSHDLEEDSRISQIEVFAKNAP